MASNTIAAGSVAEQAPAHDGIAILPSDTALGISCRALWIGGTGDVAVKFRGGATITFAGVPGGTLLPIAVSHVMAATTASGIVALY